MSLSISALCARVDSFGPGLLEPLQDLAAKRAKGRLPFGIPSNKNNPEGYGEEEHETFQIGTIWVGLVWGYPDWRCFEGNPKRLLLFPVVLLVGDIPHLREKHLLAMKQQWLTPKRAKY